MFSVGRLVTTKGIFDTTESFSDYALEISKCYKRYINKDWGDLSEDDKEMNDLALTNNNDRIFASYNTSKGKIYIITEEDRSMTTILFANEY